MKRDYDLVQRLAGLPDDTAVNAEEVAALVGFSPVTIQQRAIKGMPAPIPGPRALRWRLGDWRAWIRSADDVAVA